MNNFESSNQKTKETFIEQESEGFLLWRIFQEFIHGSTACTLLENSCYDFTTQTCAWPFWTFAIVHDLLQNMNQSNYYLYRLDAVMSSEILKLKQKLGATFNLDKQDVIDLMKFSKMTMCRASEANSEK